MKDLLTVTEKAILEEKIDLAKDITILKNKVVNNLIENIKIERKIQENCFELRLSISFDLNPELYLDGRCMFGEDLIGNILNKKIFDILETNKPIM